ncbi:hypothetical protein C0580_01835 [Candidatus Parcubacteria bacterium]|nr:MAG: hypothetical protein C0580_01835 [Candidatus Parcubacteria bacterium]
MIDPETKKILEKNQVLLKELEKKVEKIQKRMMWGAVFSTLKIIFVVGPIIFGIIYISPYVSGYFKAFKPIFQALQLAPYKAVLEGNINQDGTENSQASQQIIDSFCDPEVREVMVEQYCKEE